MEADIKCSECGKATRRFELGEMFYLSENASESIIVKNKITCPKCGKDISDRKCMVKQNELLMGITVANMSKICGGGVPKHLKGTHALLKKDYDLIKNKCLTKLNLVKRF